MFKIHSIPVLARILLLFVAVCAGQSAGRAAEIVDVRIGCQGTFKVGDYAPVIVELDSAVNGAELWMECVDPDGNPTTTRSSERIGDNQLYGEFRLGKLDGDLRLRVMSGEEEIAQRFLSATDFECLELSEYVVVTIGEPAGFEILDYRTEDLESFRDTIDNLPAMRVIPVEDPAELPTRFFAWQSIDALVLADDYDLPAEQSDAVRQWVNDGGHLIVSAGSKPDELVSSSVYKWMSAAIGVGETPQRIVELGRLEAFAGRSNRIPRTRSRRVDSAPLNVTRGNVLVSGREGPLLVESPLGFGKITMLGLDLNRAPLSRWKSLPQVCYRILFAHFAPQSDDERSQSRRLSRSGISDLATQINSSQQKMAGVQRYSSWRVMGWVGLYLLIIGPIDYLVVHRLLRRPALTWVTFPLLAIVGSFLGLQYANASNGDQLRVRQLEFVDLNAAESNQRIRSHSLFTVYSPQAQRLGIGMRAAWNTPIPDAVDSCRISWCGLPENTYGGMYRASGLALTPFPYSLEGNGQAIPNLPVQTWSTQRLQTDWNSTADISAESTLESSVIGLLKGYIQHDLPFEIHDWVLAYGSRVFRPAPDGDAAILKPGQKWFPAQGQTIKRDLKSFLKGVKSKRVGTDDDMDSKYVTEQIDYDPLNTDIGYIAQILSFHEHAGGKHYTGLNNALLRRLDLTRTVQMKRAVLFGRIEQPSTELQLDGEVVKPQAFDGFVRLVLPVGQSAQDRGALPEKDD